jgi:antitoxin (DNA-binding transcriptional repressor) of toxin-antitoxin stability system
MQILPFAENTRFNFCKNLEFPVSTGKLNIKLNFNNRCFMETVTMLDFRKNAGKIIKRAIAGERMILSYRGRAVLRFEPVSAKDDKTFSDDPFYKIGGIAAKDKKGALSNEEIDRIVYS